MKGHDLFGGEIITNLMKFLNLPLQKPYKPISTKLNTKHPWVKGIQVRLNEGSCQFPRGDNYEQQ